MTSGEPPDATTSSGIPLKPLYEAADVSADNEPPSAPGTRPYLRGAYPLMYRTKPWRIFQLSGFGNPEDEGQRIRFLLEQLVDADPKPAVSSAFGVRLPYVLADQNIDVARALVWATIPVAQITSAPNVIVVSAQSTIKSVAAA